MIGGAVLLIFLLVVSVIAIFFWIRRSKNQLKKKRETFEAMRRDREQRYMDFPARKWLLEFLKKLFGLHLGYPLGLEKSYLILRCILNRRYKDRKGKAKLAHPWNHISSNNHIYLSKFLIYLIYWMPLRMLLILAS